MPLGQIAVNNLPPIPHEVNPGLFDQRTQRNYNTAKTFNAPGNLQTELVPVSPSGIISEVTITFTGSMTVALGGGTATTQHMWPYGLVRNAAFSINWANDIIQAKGTHLDVLRFLRNPAFEDAVDTFTGTRGGGDALTSATTDLHLTWKIPVAMDAASLIGAIYAQSSQNAITVSVTQETVSAAGAANGTALVGLTGAATASITGTFTVAVTSWDIPAGEPGEGGISRVVVPDLSRLHGINHFPTVLSNTGQNRVPLIKVNGSLARLLVQVKTGVNTVVDPADVTSPDLLSLTLAYGANKEPQRWPALHLAAKNNEHYGGQLPYGFVAFDFVREHPIRDQVNMQSITDLRVMLDIASTASLGANAQIDVLEETLFA